MNNVKVREYRLGDSEQIYTLFTEQTPYVRDGKFWVWINRMLSDEKSLIVVAEFENKIVGHYAIIPKKVNVFGETHNAAFAIHAFIHPEFRNGFLIFQITKKMYKIAKEHGIEFLYGFPNKDFRDIQIKADKWKSVSLFKALEKNISSKKNTNYNLTVFKDNHSDIYALSEILDLASDKNNIYIEKNINYYINRYMRHPQNLYKNLFIVQNEIKIGFICLKIYEDEDKRIGHLIDYACTKAISFKDIINVVENHFHNKVDKLSVWKFSETDKQVLLKNGFSENGFETFLGVKMIIENEELETKLIDFKNWQICMGDSDAF